MDVVQEAVRRDPTALNRSSDGPSAQGHSWREGRAGGASSSHACSRASSEALLAASLTLSFGMIVTRSIMGLIFAREYTREALSANREESA